MAGLPYRAVRRLVGVVACLVCAAALLSGSLGGGGFTRQSFRVIQMNLCDSGIASCYTGESVTEAAAVIRAEAPDVVTLNEICQDDILALDQALTRVHGGGDVVSAFKAADDSRTADAFRCRNGQAYGIGLLARLPMPHRGYITYSGIYPSQDATDPEQRAWLCLGATAAFYACTTHLANTSSSVALAQCGHLLNTVIPAMHARGGYAPTLLGGDFNLREGGSPDLRQCIPSGYHVIDDGSVQQVMATADCIVASRKLIDMRQTDHPSLLVTLTLL